MAAGTLETVKLVSDVASNVVTIAAIIFGAIWGYWGFLRERMRWPKATLELIISHRGLSAEESLLHVKVKVHNAGRGLMKLSNLRVDVFQVLPLTESTAERLERGCLKAKGQARAEWHPLTQGISRWGRGQDLLPEPEIEPGENDEFGNDFIVPSTLRTAYISVYLENIAKKRGRELGWTVTSYYDLIGESGVESAINLIGTEAV